MKKYSAQFVLASILAIIALFLGSGRANAQEAFSASTGTNPGEVTLSWKKSVSDATNYHIVYGPQNNKSQFSALIIDVNVTIGKQIIYTFCFLNPAHPYH